MDGVDLSPLLDGKRPAKKRPYRTASYNDHVAAADDRWLLISDNQGADKRLYGSATNAWTCRPATPQHVRRLWGYALKDAGPKGMPKFK